MKPVLISQRVDVVAGRHERRDALDQRLIGALTRCGLLPVPVPNKPELVAQIWDALQPKGIVLSGGNDLVAYGGDAPERDEVEQILITQALATHLPVLGVCRGLQMIVHFFGGRLQQVEHHAGTRHIVSGRVQDYVLNTEVNSYHNWGIAEQGNALQPVAWAADNTIEAVVHPRHRVLGVMWHPEREAQLLSGDQLIIERLFS